MVIWYRFLCAPGHRPTFRSPAPPFPSFHLNPAPSQLFPGLTHFQPIRVREGFVSTNQERESIARSSNDVRVGSEGVCTVRREGKSPLGASALGRKWGDAFWRSGSASCSIIEWVTAARKGKETPPETLSGNVKVRTSEAVCLEQIMIPCWVSEGPNILAARNHVKVLQGWAKSISSVYTCCDIRGAERPWA